MTRLDAYRRLDQIGIVDGTKQPGRIVIYEKADPKKVALKHTVARIMRLLVQR